MMVLITARHRTKGIGGWGLLKSVLSVLGWEFRAMPVMLCLAAFEAHFPVLYSSPRAY